MSIIFVLICRRSDGPGPIVTPDGLELSLVSAFGPGPSLHHLLTCCYVKLAWWWHPSQFSILCRLFLLPGCTWQRKHLLSNLYTFPPVCSLLNATHSCQKVWRKLELFVLNGSVMVDATFQHENLIPCMKRGGGGVMIWPCSGSSGSGWVGFLPARGKRNQGKERGKNRKELTKPLYERGNIWTLPWAETDRI